MTGRDQNWNWTFMEVRSGPSPLTVWGGLTSNTLILKYCHLLSRASSTRHQVAAGPFYSLPLTGLYSSARCSTVTLHTAASICYRADLAHPPHRPPVLHVQLPHPKNSSTHQCRLLPGIFPNQHFSPSGKLLHMDTSQEPLGPYLPDMP